MLGKVTLWNQKREFGFVSLLNSETQYFFHRSNFNPAQEPALQAYVFFTLGAPLTVKKQIQAVGLRFATLEEVRGAQIESDAVAASKQNSPMSTVGAR
jgi:cold shock CspA family protein